MGPSGTVQVVLTLPVGLATIGDGGYSYTVQSSELDSAVKVEATITDTEVKTHEARRDTDYSPKSTFEYTYWDETYTAPKMYPGKLPKEFDSKEKARAKLEGYEPGYTVTAYVPTDSPGNAYLEHESSDKPFLVIGIGALFVLFAAYSAIRN